MPSGSAGLVSRLGLAMVEEYDPNPLIVDF